MATDTTILPPTVSEHIASTLHDLLEAIGSAATGGFKTPVDALQQADYVSRMAAAVESLTRAAAIQRDAEAVG